MDDLQIIELYFARDEQAVKETAAKYGKLCLRIAENILNNNADSEECVNDTYLAVWNDIPPTRPINLMAFICRIARNLSLKRLESNSRQKRAQNMVVSLSELEEVLQDDSISSNMNDEDIGKIISDFLRKEKEDSRNIFIRKYYFFDSVGDIAARYSYSVSKVKSMLFQTRKKLKEYLIKEGIEI